MIISHAGLYIPFRLSISDIEEVVAECAVIGIEDELKGQVPIGFVILKGRFEIDDEGLELELIRMFRKKVGLVTGFRRDVITKRLPKT